MDIKNLAPYTVTELYDDFFSIDEGGVRTFLIVGEDSAYIIDSGFGKGDLMAQIREITPLPVTLVQTHADGDHTGANACFDTLMISPAELYNYKAHKAPKIAKVLPLWDGEVVKFGAYSFRVLLIPGHTPGSIALLEEDRRFLISGDSVQDGAVFMFGEGRSMEAYLMSLRRLESLRDSFDTVHPSHGALSVDAGIIPDLIAGCEKYIAGELVGAKPPLPLPCLVYSYGRAKFLCE